MVASFVEIDRNIGHFWLLVLEPERATSTTYGWPDENTSQWFEYGRWPKAPLILRIG